MRNSRSLLMVAINADLEPVPEPLEPKPMPTPAYVVAAFAPLPTVSVGEDLTREHAVCLDAYRHACGMSAWLDQKPNPQAPTAAQINQAVTWWNSWHKTKTKAANR